MVVNKLVPNLLEGLGFGVWGLGLRMVVNKLVPNLLEDTGRGDSVAIQEQQLRCHSHGLIWFLCVSVCLHLCVSAHVFLCACVHPILSVHSLSVCPCLRWL